MPLGIKMVYNFNYKKVYMRTIFIFILLSVNHAFADMKYHPTRFTLNIDSEYYFEGEKILVQYNNHKHGRV
jgi:hypothetical protein